MQYKDFVAAKEAEDKNIQNIYNSVLFKKIVDNIFNYPKTVIPTREFSNCSSPLFEKIELLSYKASDKLGYLVLSIQITFRDEDDERKYKTFVIFMPQDVVDDPETLFDTWAAAKLIKNKIEDVKYIRSLMVDLNISVEEITYG